MRAVNAMVLYLFLPALIFDVMASGEFSVAAYKWLAVASFIIVIGSGIMAWPLTRILKLPVRSFVPCMMFNNCGNLGLPLAVLAFGESALAGAMVLFLVSNLMHFTLGTMLLGGVVTLSALILNPVNLATLAGLGFNIAGVTLPGTLALPISMLGDIGIPLMLVSLGVRMANSDASNLWAGALAAVLCPLTGLIVGLMLAQVLPLSPEQVGLMLLFSALPPAVLNFLFAEQYQQHPDQVASMVLMGNLGSIVVLSLVLSWLI